MEKYEIVDKKIMSGYDHLHNKDSLKACDVWLDAWEDIKAIMNESDMCDIALLQDKYDWTEFLTNYAQDLEEELHNAGIKNNDYLRKRILYCEEMIELCGNSDDLIIENARRSIAESYFRLGDEAECFRLYEVWLKDDPNWGWGYIGKSDIYYFEKDRTTENLEKSAAVLAEALTINEIRDRSDILERAIMTQEALGNHELASKMHKELENLRGYTIPDDATNKPELLVKVGRNDPCPCGSGKKYKKCCGD